jgi:hypothetical protein
MNSVKIYNKTGKILFNKNKFFCFIYKYETGKETMYSINMNEKPSKFHSLFEYITYSQDEEIRISLTQDCIDYEIKSVNNKVKLSEKGRIPLKLKKKNWSKKSIKLENENTLEVETFDGYKSVICKLKDEVIENLIKINNGNKRKKRIGN